MKNIFNLRSALAMLACAALAMPLVSCGGGSDDSDAPDFDVPTYEAQAAKYNIQGSRYFESIELTASGNYIIIAPSDDYYYAPARDIADKPIVSFIANGVKASRASYDNVTYGTYTIDEVDGTYHLDGFGTMKVVREGGSNYTIKLNSYYGNYTLDATIERNMASSTMTDKLCRTWYIDSYKMTLGVPGVQTVSATGSTMAELARNLARKLDMDASDIQDMMPLFQIEIENFIFTKAGTYLVTYVNSAPALSHWRWVNESKGKLRYSWSNNFNDQQLSGDVNLKFSGKKLIIEEDLAKNNNMGDQIVMELTYTLTY